MNKRAKMLVDARRYQDLERLFADVLAINCAVCDKQAARYIKRAIETAIGLDNQDNFDM
jgi:hypothetical protein